MEIRVIVCRDNQKPNKAPGYDPNQYTVWKYWAVPFCASGMWETIRNLQLIFKVDSKDWNGDTLEPGEGPVLMELSARRVATQGGKDET